MPNDSLSPDQHDAETTLATADLDNVSGGLNPQPLPPLDGGGDIHVNPVGIPKLVR